MKSFAKVGDRDALKPRRDPYWMRLSKGCYLGFRKMTTQSEGTWTARHLNQATGRQERRPLGDFTELPKGLRFDAAKAAAEAWFSHLGVGGLAGVVTVRDACDKYVSHVAAKRGDRAANDARARFNAYVLDDRKLAETDLSKLTPAHIESWVNRLRKRPTRSGGNRGGQRSSSTLNRDMTCFRAALNLALKDQWVTSDRAWKSKLEPIPHADRRREVYLTVEERKRLVAAAPADLADFLRGLSLIPLRPGALAALKAGDFQKRLGTLRIGKDKNHQERTIALPSATSAFFQAMVRDKLPTAHIFARASGTPWDKDAWKKPIKACVKAAKLPEEATAYAIRHSVITDLIHAGVDPVTVAKLSGTSVRMIESNYAHLTEEHAKKSLALLAI